jgi:hypothetical protein
MGPFIPSAFVAVLLGGLNPALAALPCGDQPEVPATEQVKLKQDAEAKSDLVRHAPASVNVRALVSATRHELRDKYSKIDKATVDHYLLWVTCQSISGDKSLAPSQKFDEYSTFYRLMSEPIQVHQAGEKAE